MSTEVRSNLRSGPDRELTDIANTYRNSADTQRLMEVPFVALTAALRSLGLVK